MACTHESKRNDKTLKWNEDEVDVKLELEVVTVTIGSPHFLSYLIPVRNRIENWEKKELKLPLPLTHRHTTNTLLRLHFISPHTYDSPEEAEKPGEARRGFNQTFKKRHQQKQQQQATSDSITKYLSVRISLRSTLIIGSVIRSM